MNQIISPRANVFNRPLEHMKLKNTIKILFVHPLIQTRVYFVINLSIIYWYPFIYIVDNCVPHPGTVNKVLSLWICFCTVIKSKSYEVTSIQASVWKGYGEFLLAWTQMVAVCLLLSHLPLGSDLSYHFSAQSWPVTDRTSRSGFKWMCCSLNGWASSTQQKDWGVWTMWCGI